MDRTYIKDVKEKIGQDVKLEAWVHTIRDQGSIKFLLLRDISGLMQGIILKTSESFKVSEGLTTESVVEIFGKVKEENQAPGGFEVEVQSIKVLSHADPNLPIPVVTEKGAEKVDITKRFDWRWIDLRKPENQKIFKVWTSLEEGFRRFFLSEKYVQIYTPSFMNAPSEGGAEFFEANYFDKKAYLAQSPQFYKQAAMAAGFEKVFMTGPVFRAEPSFTTRHMTEFTGWDFEISYTSDHHEVMDEHEKMIISGFKKVKKEIITDLEVPISPFPRVTMKEAKEKLAMEGVKSEKDFDVSPEEERKLCEIIKREAGHDFVFLIDWPIEGRPFYHKHFDENDKITKSYDLLYKGLEITTGAQREHRVEVLESQAKEKGVDTKPLENYFNFFRYGCPPHGGGGIGPARIIMQMLELSSVKEATFLPRDVKRLTP